MKTLKRKIKKLIYRIGQILIYFGKPDSPFGEEIQASKDQYLRLAKEAYAADYPEIDRYEKMIGFSIDSNWINNLALHTQIVKKESALNFAHGRVLYSALRSYIVSEDSVINDENINIIETGTARGFSALCMAKAMHDSDTSGSIVTFDLIPNEAKIFWNCIDDIDGKKTRLELLKNWESLVSKYLIFVEGDTRTTLKDVSLNRVNFAFLDGAHTYEDVMFEFSTISGKQFPGDMIIYDDYNPLLFPGIVGAVDEICTKFGYSRIDLQSDGGRGYVIAKKMNDS